MAQPMEQRLDLGDFFSAAAVRSDRWRPSTVKLLGPEALARDRERVSS